MRNILQWIGDSSVQEFEGRQLVYVAAGSDPFSVINNSVKYVHFNLSGYFTSINYMFMLCKLWMEC